MRYSTPNMSHRACRHERKEVGETLLDANNSIRTEENNTVSYRMNTIDPQLLEVRRSSLCRMEDYREGNIQILKESETENKYLKKRTHQ